MGGAYYNEIDPHAAQWLRNLIAAGEIAPGEVDERDIRDVRPDELAGFTQCHFFAGIGIWSHALRKAGWRDDRPVWTGSCPCQPFSSAGRRAGTADERHLWPHWHHLIRECSPGVVFGEQVASKDGRAWFDLVQADLEGLDYAAGAFDLCAAGVGAPHIRQRLYFVARAERVGDTDRARGAVGLPEPSQRKEGLAEVDDNGSDRLFRPGSRRPMLGGVEYAHGRNTCEEREQSGGKQRFQPENRSAMREGFEGSRLEPDRLANPKSKRWDGRESTPWETGRDGAEVCGANHRPSPTNGFWGSADWLGCRDGKFRPVEPGTSPLVDGASFSVDSGSPYAGKSRGKMLSGFGNGIVADQAAGFIADAMSAFSSLDESEAA